MGWASGSDVMIGVIRAVRSRVSDEETRRWIYRDVVTVLKRHDCDTLMEALGYDAAYDDLMRTLKPEWFAEMEVGE